MAYGPPIPWSYRTRMQGSVCRAGRPRSPGRARSPSQHTGTSAQQREAVCTYSGRPERGKPQFQPQPGPQPGTRRAHRHPRLHAWAHSEQGEGRGQNRQPEEGIGAPTVTRSSERAHGQSTRGEPAPEGQAVDRVSRSSVGVCDFVSGALVGIICRRSQLPVRKTKAK